MKRGQRVVVIVLDGAGVGEMPDAAEYGDVGSNTIGNTARAVGGLRLPNMEALGLGNLTDIPGVRPRTDCHGAYGVMLEHSKGKDTTTGHWEMMGIITERPFPTYPHGFPPEVIRAFEAAIGRDALGNYPASGTVIIEQLGEEHMLTGEPIVYTSADSVFQIAAHEEVIPVEELYEMCRKARAILTGEHNVARVIARPFVGKPGDFRRTERRRDFSLAPPRLTAMDALVDAGHEVYGIGKIEDIFAGRGLTQAVHIANNIEGIERTIEAMESVNRGLIFTNLVDFDMVYGHRNNPNGFARGLEEFDAHLPGIQAAMRPDDLLIITADHGVDPTTPSTDHSREKVPLLVWMPGMQRCVDLGERQTFADLAATMMDLFGLDLWPVGESFAASVQYSSRYGTKGSDSGKT